MGNSWRIPCTRRRSGPGGRTVERWNGGTVVRWYGGTVVRERHTELIPVCL